MPTLRIRRMKLYQAIAETGRRSLNSAAEHWCVPRPCRNWLEEMRAESGFSFFNAIAGRTAERPISILQPRAHSVDGLLGVIWR